MNNTAYVLIITESSPEDVLKKVREIENVTEAFMVSDPYDIIAKVEGGSEEIEKTARHIRKYDNVLSTLKMPLFEGFVRNPKTGEIIEI
jgi:DNA-binding Lrp family transcriptional regulator